MKVDMHLVIQAQSLATLQAYHWNKRNKYFKLRNIMIVKNPN